MTVLIDVRNAKKYFGVETGLVATLRDHRILVKVIDWISFTLKQGERRPTRRARLR